MFRAAPTSDCQSSVLLSTLQAPPASPVMASGGNRGDHDQESGSNCPRQIDPVHESDSNCEPAQVLLAQPSAEGQADQQGAEQRCPVPGER